MSSKKLSTNAPKVSPATLKAFEKILERSLESLEQRVTGRIRGDIKDLEQNLRAELAKKADVEGMFNKLNAELAKKADKSDVEDLKNVVLKYMEIHGKTHEKIETRLNKLETAVSTSN